MHSVLKAASRRKFLQTLPRDHPPLQQHAVVSAAAACRFSSEAEAAVVVKKELPVVFQYPKAQALFERITATVKTVEDVRAMQREVYNILGRPLREHEFYYDGFGGKKKTSGGAGGAAESAPVLEVKTVFDVKLVGFDASAKIKVIKEIRSIAGLGLKEAKDLVESAPCTIQKGIKTEAAEEIKAKLMEIGAQIELV
jgi:large subunit ribosomal protein L7/L12